MLKGVSIACIATIAYAGSDAPLKVNGHTVSERQIQRWLIEGPCRAKLEERKIAFLIEREIARRAEEAARKLVPVEQWRIAHNTQPTDAAIADDARRACTAARMLTEARIRNAVVPTAEDCSAEWQRTVDRFRERFPTLDVDAEFRRSYRSMDWARASTSQRVLFERLFFPDDPDDWPTVTLDAVRADSGADLIDDARASYAIRRAESMRSGKLLAHEDPLYCSMLREIVITHLSRSIDFKTSFDGVSEDLVMTADADMDGQQDLVLTVDEMWRDVQATVVPSEFEDAKQWFVTSMATADRLRADGVLLDSQACTIAVRELIGHFDGDGRMFDSIATQSKGFPSVQAYEEYVCLQRAFETRIAGSLATRANGELAPLLIDHAARAAATVRGRFDIECILISPFDIPGARWKPNGWVWAKRMAFEVRDALATHATSDAQHRVPASSVLHLQDWSIWDEALAARSEFWDPPIAATGTDCRGPAANHGRFGPLSYEELQRKLGESQYTHWVTGRSATEFAALDQPIDSVAGPYRIPSGYALLRVKQRDLTFASLRLKSKEDIETLREDYVRSAFVAYARDAVEHADVQGFIRDL